MPSQSAQLDEALKPQLESRRKEGLYRQRVVVGGYLGINPIIEGRSYLAFCGNDYLGLANHPDVIAALKKWATECGVGSGASHLVIGHGYHHHALEEELADFTGRERALLFSTGYMANLGVATALAGRGDTLFEDRLNHASLVDAGLLSRARLHRYRHGDVRSLEERLGKVLKGRMLVLTDGVFSMDGDVAPLKEMAESASRFGGWLMVDDAHGLGVVGGTGRGSLEVQGLGAEDIPVLMGTLGKAFGTFGAFVAGSEALIETLIQQARPYVYTTALPPAVAAATRTSLRLVREETWRREHLYNLTQRFKSGLRQLGLPVPSSTTPIQPLILGDSRQALEAGNALMDRGIFVTPIRPPTVPHGTARLRITFSAAHEEENVDRLLEALSEVIG